MSQKKIAVVTGAAGFIGSHMVDALLSAGYQVRAIDNQPGPSPKNLEHQSSNKDVSYESIDIRTIKPDHAMFKGAEFVFHFAGLGDIVPSVDHPVDYMSVNVMGTVQVLEAARHAKVKKLVYAASSSCYGKTSLVPTDENAPIHPEYPYALSKYQGEQAALHWQKVYGLPVVSIRIFNAYGPRARTTGAYGAVFKVFLAQKLAGKPFTVVGDGKQSRDFLYVTDIADAFLKAAQNGRDGEIYNLGAGQPQSVNRLIELLQGEVIRLPKRPGEPDCTWANISKITHETGWKPKVSFEEGVAKMVEGIDYWRDAKLWDVASIEAATKNWFDMLKDKK